MNRCFYDRLMNVKDRKTYYSVVQSGIRVKMKEDFKNVIGKSHPELKKLSGYEFQNNVEVLESLLFNDLDSVEVNAKDRKYEEILDQDSVSKKVESHLEDYNSVSKKPMQLVLFWYAIYNLLKISRVIKLEQVHVLLIGLGGSGRNSLSRFAVYLRDYHLVELDMT